MNRSSISARRLTGLAAFAAAVVLAVTGCSTAASTSPRSAESSSLSAASQAAEANPNIDLGASLDSKPAPDFTLLNQFGQSMSLSQFKGRPVVLSFEDPLCTDICPLTSQSLVLAKELLGDAGKPVQLLGVSANPAANQVSDVMDYTRAHGLVNQWDMLTGSDAQLKKVWTDYSIGVQVDDGDVTHTPAIYVINQQGVLDKVYLTQMAYSSITQSAQVIASELATLLPGHPKLKSLESLAQAPVQAPATSVTLPAAATAGSAAAGGQVTLGPGQSRLVVFFASWLAGDDSDLKAELARLTQYAAAAADGHLPALTAVDETVTETSAQAAGSFLGSLGRLSYPVALDETGRLADGYGVQDLPWLTVVNAAGKVTWQHDGWVSLSTLEQAAAAHAG